jgi:excisionase family DNA binding protein
VDETDIMTMADVCKYLHVHSSTIYRLLRKKALPAFRVGSDWRFSRTLIDRWRLEQPTASDRRRRQ